MDEKTFPQEAGVDGRAVHYDKGCYVGQEAMAKIHFRGKVNRRLAVLNAEGTLDPGTVLKLDDAKVGEVTSAADGAALALIRYSVEPGTALDAEGVTATVAS
jgi:folate-binding protein YgfZ